MKCNRQSTAYLCCLNGEDVIAAKISDHHPLIHAGVLFWNIMMQGKMRVGKFAGSYNNGFGIEETDSTYIKRLMKIAMVIAEIIYKHPAIDTIAICEGPICSEHLKKFLHALRQFTSLKRFFDKNCVSVQNKSASPWGLLLLADKKYIVRKHDYELNKYTNLESKLLNRFQLWRFSNGENEKYLALAHFPFGGDERVGDRNKLSEQTFFYCDLVRNILNRYENENFIFCADFNFNPYLVSEYKDRVLDKISNHNSILLTLNATGKSKIDTVTVDGILLSDLTKQKIHHARNKHGLFRRLTIEHQMSQKVEEVGAYLDASITNQHSVLHTQVKMFDLRHG